MAVTGWLLLIAGAIVGVAVDRAWDRLHHAYDRRAQRCARSRRQRNILRARSDIVEHYRSRGDQDALYIATTFKSRPLPVLARGADRLSGPVDAYNDAFLTVENSVRVALPTNGHLIRQRSREGAQLWDGDLLFVTGADLFEESPVRVRAALCNYFSYVTYSARLVKDIRRKRWTALDQHYGNLNRLIDGSVRPVAIAAAVTCVFHTHDGDVEVAVQRRSSGVVNGAGELGVIPIFGFESTWRGRARSKYSVLFYNFVKEFVEEFYGLENLERSASSANLAPDWIFETSQAREVLDEFEAGRLALSVTRVGADLTEGNLTFAMLAEFKSPDFFDRLKLGGMASWESQEFASGTRPVEFLPLFDPELNTSAQSMYPTSLFSLDLARQALSRAADAT